MRLNCAAIPFDLLDSELFGYEKERHHILNALDESNWIVGGKSGAAARLGMARTTLIAKIRKCGISRELPQRHLHCDGERRQRFVTSSSTSDLQSRSE